MRIGLAVSGGGHRATAWAVGSAAALVETGATADLVSLSSVSGGSIANGAVAKAGNLREQRDTAAFAADMGPTLRVAAVDGLFFPGPATRPYLMGALGFVGLTLLALLGLLAAATSAGRGTGLIGYAIAGAFAAAAIGWKLGGFIRLPRSLLLVVGAAGGSLTTWGGAALTGDLYGSALWLTLAGLAVAWLAMAYLAAVLVSRRGKAVERALGRGLLASPNGIPLTLADVASGVNHVICATDLESGDQFYFSPRFLYGYREGISVAAPSAVTLAAAVQASAALPGAFPPSVIATGPFTRDASVTDPATPPERVVLADGGVYDNMADQWELGLVRRLKVCADLVPIQQPAEVLVVANASEGWGWRPFTAKGRIGRELLGLMRDQSVQYDVSTSRRRSQLFERFKESREDGAGLQGVIVMIDRLPMTLAAPFEEGSDPVAVRANQAVLFIDAQHSAAEWEAMAERNASVATTLGPIGKETTLDLMEHAYTSTVVGLFVLHDIGRLTPFPRAVYAAAIDEVAT